MVPEDHYLSDELHAYFEKYYAADPQFKTEHRYRLLRYIRQIAHGEIAEMSPGGDIHGGGAPEMCRLAIWREANVEYCEDLIKRILAISNKEFTIPEK